MTIRFVPITIGGGAGREGRLETRPGNAKDRRPFGAPVFWHIALRRERMAGATGLEPATSGVTGRHSNRLSYAPAVSLPGQHPVGDGARLRPPVGPVKRRNSTFFPSLRRRLWKNTHVPLAATAAALGFSPSKDDRGIRRRTVRNFNSPPEAPRTAGRDDRSPRAPRRETPSASRDARAERISTSYQRGFPMCLRRSRGWAKRAS